MQTIGTLFSGGEGVGVGARQAGFDHLWGVEWDDKIAAVGRMNGFNTLTGDVRDVELMSSLPRTDVLHASPVCKNASNAKADGEESAEDIAMADAVCAYINYFKPDIFTLENVWGYRIFTAFAHIIECLNRHKYRVDYWHLNAADYGVPQTRQRLILVARLHGKPRKPHATHARPDKLTPLFDDRLPWIGWYAAIEDLIDTLPASKFAPWQLERLPDELKDSFIVHSTEMRTTPIMLSDDPCFMQTVGMSGSAPRAFILNGTPNDYGASVTACASDDPVYTMTGSMDKRPARAFITDAQNGHGGTGETTLRNDDEPISTFSAEGRMDTFRAFTVQGANTQSNGKVYNMQEETARTVDIQAMPKAFIMPNANTSSGVMRNGDEPAPTQGNADRVGNQPRAFLLGDQQQQIADTAEPSNTIRAFSNGGTSPRAWLSAGRVVKMTPRALARFQSFPDSYILPDKAKLACTVIDNAVPPLLYQRVIEAQL